MNPVELERRLQRIERALEDLASAGRPRIRIGSWTPDMYGGTTYGSTTYFPGYRIGHFMVINQMCWITIELYWTSTTATGEMRFTLPLSTVSGRPQSVFTVRHDFIAYPSGATIRATADPATTYFKLIRAMPDGTTAFLDVSSSGYIAVSGLYWIA